MYIIGHFFKALASVLDIALSIYMWLIIIRVLLSWVSPDPYNPIVKALRSVTDPVMDWFRRRIPLVFGGFDFSPMVVIFLIYFLRQFLVPVFLKLSIQYM